jgi:hypothetical protein
VDDICLIRSMHTGANGHEVSIRYFHGGIPGVLGRPTLGSWLVYALGCESQNLPAYMVLSDPGGLPVDGVTNWSNGFMPALFQGTVLRPKEPRILNLEPPPHLKGTFQAAEPRSSANAESSVSRDAPGRVELEARIASYELAARMQTAASRSAGSLAGNRSDAKTVRSGRSRHSRVRHALSDRAAAGRTGSPVRATVSQRTTVG